MSRELAGGSGAVRAVRWNDERELSRLQGRRRARPNAITQRVPRRQDTVVPRHVESGRWHQCAQPCQKGVRRHLSKGGAGLAGCLEVDADLTVIGATDCVVGEGGTEEISAQAHSVVRGRLRSRPSTVTAAWRFML